MKIQILKLLQESQDYVSGQKICDELGVSRTAVWKNIKSLQEDGYDIKAIPNKGYRLCGEPDSITKEACQSLFTTKWAGCEMEYFDEIDSTNNRCKLRAEQGAEQGLLVVADKQTAGRGRRGRSWSNPSGTFIAMSLLLKPQIEPNDASMLTLVAALAVTEGIRKVSGLPATIKWPNDIVLNGKKVCGILTEMSAEMSCIHYVVVGIGINVNNDSFPEEIADNATSLLLEGGHPVMRNRVIAEVMISFEKYYEMFLENGNLALLKEMYETYLINKDRDVRILGSDGKGEEIGFAMGIDDRGQLLVKLKDGTVKAVMSGEVSVRGIYGYV